MKRRTFLKGLFATTLTLPAMPALGMMKEQDYSFTISKVEVIRLENNFRNAIRGIATLDSNSEHICQFAYAIDDDESVIASFNSNNLHDNIKLFFKNKLNSL